MFHMALDSKKTKNVNVPDVCRGCSFLHKNHFSLMRELPFRITYSLYFENIMNYYFYLKDVREGE